MEEHRSYCPINLSLEVFGDKWSFIILRDIMFADKRYFRELLQTEEGISSNILADRLTMLEREGIISKSDDPSHRQKIRYSLTKKGIDLLPVLIELSAWSVKYKPVDMKRHKQAVNLVKRRALNKSIAKRLLDEHLNPT